jgi:hypothetical protein
LVCRWLWLVVCLRLGAWQRLDARRRSGHRCDRCGAACVPVWAPWQAH